MEVLRAISFLVGGVIILAWGANLLVVSASHIAQRFKISPVIIGLTVVAYGTSAPEMAVNVIASIQGNSEIAMGNIVGSTIFNVAFILGFCSLLKPLFVTSQLIRFDIPIMVGTSSLLWIMAMNNHISKVEGLILIIGIVTYTFMQAMLALKDKNLKKEFTEELGHQKIHPMKDVMILITGLLLLIGGAKIFIEGAISGARLLGWSEEIIALTVIAAGTSLPEVATSITATLRNERDIAIGNVVGSNIFNILAILGISAVISHNGLPVSNHMANVDIPFMLVIAIICLPFTIWRKQLDRFLGLAFVCLWLGYIFYLTSMT